MPPRHNRLTRFLPRAGMIYKDGEIKLGRARQDFNVMIALEHAGFAEVFVDAKSRTKKLVDKAFAEIFSAALRPDILKHLTSEGEGVADFLDALKEAIPWISGFMNGTIYRLCCCLVEARKAWHANPRQPYDPAMHCATAKAIDQLIQASRDRWSTEFEAYFVLAGSFPDDDMLMEEEGEHPDPEAAVGLVEDKKRDEKVGDIDYDHDINVIMEEAQEEAQEEEEDDIEGEEEEGDVWYDYEEEMDYEMDYE
ncbi:hypothetical protein F5Y06DRAFT_295818 [Hypoxylon sp. FL0890]|nr:hypothetical protein F5Y06DRAFT_295818 [Hypoxylon sp. FL0890]